LKLVGVSIFYNKLGCFCRSEGKVFPLQIAIDKIPELRYRDEVGCMAPFFAGHFKGKIEQSLPWFWIKLFPVFVFTSTGALFDDGFLSRLKNIICSSKKLVAPLFNLIGMNIELLSKLAQRLLSARVASATFDLNTGV